MAKFVCSVCGYVYEGEEAPAQCPVCKAPAEKFIKQSDDKTWASEHVVGVAQGAPEDIMEDLRANFKGECSEVGMYLAMARVASQRRLSGDRYCTGRKQLTKRLSMQLNLQSFLAKLLQTAQRRTLR